MNTSTSKPVSLARRLGAVFYDTLLIGTTVLIMGGILSTITTRLLGMDYLDPAGLLARLFFILEIGMAFALFGWFWTHGGQTLGMRAWKIRVVDEQGKTLNWQQSFFRFVAALFSCLAAGAGFWIAAFDPENKTWHDRFSRTYLVHV